MKFNLTIGEKIEEDTITGIQYRGGELGYNYYLVDSGKKIDKIKLEDKDKKLKKAKRLKSK